MIIANGALQLLVTGSHANGGIIIIPEHFNAAALAAAALAAAEKVRRGLCKKIDESDELLFILSDNYLVVIKCYGKLWSANHPFARHIVQTTVYILSILYCHWSHQSVILFIFANTTRNRSIPSMWWMTRGCYVLSRLVSSCKLVVMVD
jgi:hypothetical protein